MMLTTIAHISLVYGPVILLVAFQLCFLPYHYEGITLWHRLLIVLDGFLIWILWPRVLTIKTAKQSLPYLATLALFSAGVFFLAFTIATFPGEWLDSHLPEVKLGGYSPYKLLVAGEVDLTARKPKSLWSNRLVVPGVDVLDHSKFDSEEKIGSLLATLSLRGRHLEGAVLIGSNLRKSDFTGAILTGANLGNADLRGANFGCDRFGDDANCTRLEGAILNSANLEGAFLDKANLQGASLNYARFFGASLKSAKMSGVSGIQAEFVAALLDGVDMRGAYLDGTVFRLASLRGADFRGAMFYTAQLQGADVNLANFDGAILKRVFIWRVQSSESFTDQDAYGSSPEIGAEYFCADRTSDCDWSAVEYSALKARVDKQFALSDPQDFRSKVALLNPESKLPDVASLEKEWDDFVEDEESDDFDQTRLEALTQVACDQTNGQYVIRNYLRPGSRYLDGGIGKKLASALNGPSCVGASALTLKEKAELFSLSDKK